MRVISGRYKGKKLEGYDVLGTRPTMARVKESLFAIIQNNIKGKIALDLFAGTGSLGIEFLSNGGNTCYFVDNGPKIKKYLQNNIRDISGSIYLELDYKKALEQFKNKNIKFDVIFLDPPYNMHLINNALELIEKYDLIADNGIIICEYIDEIINVTTYELIKNKKYGDKYITIYKYVKQMN